MALYCPGGPHQSPGDRLAVLEGASRDSAGAIGVDTREGKGSLKTRAFGRATTRRIMPIPPAEWVLRNPADDSSVSIRPTGFGSRWLTLSCNSSFPESARLRKSPLFSSRLEKTFTLRWCAQAHTTVFLFRSFLSRNDVYMRTEAASKFFPLKNFLASLSVK